MRTRGARSTPAWVAAALLLTACHSAPDQRLALDQHRADALTIFQQVWPTLAAAADSPAVATGSFDACDDDGATMGYQAAGYVPAKGATLDAAAATAVGRLLEANGWTARPAVAGAPIRYDKGRAFVTLQADHGQYVLSIVSDCSPVSEATRQQLPTPEKLPPGSAGTPRS